MMWIHQLIIIIIISVVITTKLTNYLLISSSKYLCCFFNNFNILYVILGIILQIQEVNMISTLILW